MNVPAYEYYILLYMSWNMLILLIVGVASFFNPDKLFEKREGPNFNNSVLQWLWNRSDEFLNVLVWLIAAPSVIVARGLDRAIEKKLDNEPDTQ